MKKLLIGILLIVVVLFSGCSGATQNKTAPVVNTDQNNPVNTPTTQPVVPPAPVITVPQTPDQTVTSNIDSNAENTSQDVNIGDVI